MKFVLLLAFVVTTTSVLGNYEPNWKSLDGRPLPPWYDESKLGIFVHWGVFSVPSFKNEWFWWHWKGLMDGDYVAFMKNNYKPSFTYADFAAQFTAEFYEPKKWAQLFKKSGAKYVVLTSKHHEGFTMWPSPVSWNWNAMDVGPKRDLLGDLSVAVREVGLKFGAYHSLLEWFNPLYIGDKMNAFRTQDFVDRKTMPELRELVEKYKAELIWSDGNWEGDDDYWKSKEFLTWLYNESPVKDTVVTNDRWGNNTVCKHGGYLTCQDHFMPGKLLARKWENCMTVDRGTWGFSRVSTLTDYLSIGEILHELVQTVSYGGNLLLNVGPTHDGRIVPIMEERLTQLGEWLQVNGEAIYNTRPWTSQNDSLTVDVFYTKSGANSVDSNVYGIFFDWPANDTLSLGSVAPSSDLAISLISKSAQIPLKLTAVGQRVDVKLPARPLTDWAWVLVIKKNN